MEQRHDRALRALAGLAARLRLPEQVELRGLAAGLLDRDRLIKAAPFAAGGLVVLVLLAITWHKTAAMGSQEAGFRTKCAAPDCGRVFVIPRDEAQTWPRGRAGEGLKCPHCDKLSGRMAVHCDKCDEYFIPGTDGRPGCPRCSPPPPAALAGPPRAAAPSRSESPSRGNTPAKRPPPGMGR